jgi:kynurenine formamidase
VPRRIIDLSPVLTPDLPRRVWGKELLARSGYAETTEFDDIVRRPPGEGNWAGFVANSYWTLMNHGGPHVDAPNHLFEGAASVADYPLTQLIGPLKVVDARSQPQNEPIPRAFFDGAGIRPGDVVLLVVGYVPPSTAGELPRYPYLSREAAEYLAAVPIRAFATDAWSVDCPPRDDRPRGGPVVHSAFLLRGIPTIEQLVNVQALLEEPNAVFVGFPLRVQGASGNGSPIRAAALIY